MEIVQIWQFLEKNATQIMIFLRNYMWKILKSNAYLIGSFMRSIMADYAANYAISKAFAQFALLAIMYVGPC